MRFGSRFVAGFSAGMTVCNQGIVSIIITQSYNGLAVLLSRFYHSLRFKHIQKPSYFTCTPSPAILEKSSARGKFSPSALYRPSIEYYDPFLYSRSLYQIKPRFGT